MKKLVSIILAVIMLMPVFAAAAVSASAANTKTAPAAVGNKASAKAPVLKGNFYGDEGFDEIYVSDLYEETSVFIDLEAYGADYYEIDYYYSPYVFSEYDDESDAFEFYVEGDNWLTAENINDGLSIVYLDLFENGRREDVYVGTLTYVFVVRDPSYRGYITDFWTDDLVMSYNSESNFDYYYSSRGGDAYAYTLEYYVDCDKDSSFATLGFDDYGYVNSFGSKPATHQLVTYCIDTNGNFFSSYHTVTVKYTFLQWLIVIFLFGWIWY